MLLFVGICDLLKSSGFYIWTKSLLHTKQRGGMDWGGGANSGSLHPLQPAALKGAEWTELRGTLLHFPAVKVLSVTLQELCLQKTV